MANFEGEKVHFFSTTAISRIFFVGTFVENHLSSHFSIHSRTHHNLDPIVLELPLQGHPSPCRGQTQWLLVYPCIPGGSPILPLSSPFPRSYSFSVPLHLKVCSFSFTGFSSTNVLTVSLLSLFPF